MASVRRYMGRPRMGHEPFGLRYAGKSEAIALAHSEVKTHLVFDPAASMHPERPSDVLIEGDNLDALKRLRSAYTAQVQCIYIDPPYNTGHDFVYRDTFAESSREYLQRTGQRDDEGGGLVHNPETHGRFHSQWLAMMEPRLRVAHELLREDGLLFASIDDHEVHHLRLLLDEIFGPECFVSQVVVIGNRGGRDYLRIATTHEYLLVYGKSPDAPVRSLPRPPATNALNDARGPYELRELRNRNPRFSPANRPNLFYPVWVDASAEKRSPLCPVSLEPRAGWEKVEPRNRAGDGSVWRWGQPKLRAALVAGDPVASEVVARRRRDGVFNIYEKHRAQTTKARSVWDGAEMRSEQGTRTLREHLGVAAFDHPKPVELVQRCLQLGMDADGLVLDFFAGSGTTAEAVTRLNADDGGTRRFVLVQLPEGLPSDAVARSLGAETVTDITRLRLAAIRTDDRGLRCFRLAEAASDDPWPIALAAGFPLDAKCVEIGAKTWSVASASRRLVVCLADALDDATIDAWNLVANDALACRATALSDELALNLARRQALTLL